MKRPLSVLCVLDLVPTQIPIADNSLSQELYGLV